MVCLNISSMNLLAFSKCTSSYLSNIYHLEIVHRCTMIMVPGHTLMKMKWSVVVVSMCAQKFLPDSWLLVVIYAGPYWAICSTCTRREVCLGNGCTNSNCIHGHPGYMQKFFS